MFYGDGVALVEVTAQLKVFADGVTKVVFAHLSEKLCQVVYDEAVLIGKKLGPHLWNFPARYVGVEAVKESGVDHCIGKGREQVSPIDST